MLVDIGGHLVEVPDDITPEGIKNIAKQLASKQAPRSQEEPLEPLEAGTSLPEVIYKNAQAGAQRGVALMDAAGKLAYAANQTGEAQDKALEEFSQALRKLSSIPMPEGYEQVSGDASFLEVLNSLLDKDAAAQFIAQALVTSTPPMVAGAAAGAATGPAGPIAGAGAVGATSAILERSLSTLDFVAEQMNKQGYDINNPADVKVFLNHPGFYEAITDKATQRGLAVGAVDTATFGLIRPLSRLGRFLTRPLPMGVAPAVRGTAQVGMQASLEGVGEYAGQVAAGQPVDMAEVYREAIISGPVEAATETAAALAARKQALEPPPVASGLTPPQATPVTSPIVPAPVTPTAPIVAPPGEPGKVGIVAKVVEEGVREIVLPSSKKGGKPVRVTLPPGLTEKLTIPETLQEVGGAKPTGAAATPATTTPTPPVTKPVVTPVVEGAPKSISAPSRSRAGYEGALAPQKKIRAPAGVQTPPKEVIPNIPPPPKPGVKPTIQMQRAEPTTEQAEEGKIAPTPAPAVVQPTVSGPIGRGKKPAKVIPSPNTPAPPLKPKPEVEKLKEDMPEIPESLRRAPTPPKAPVAKAEPTQAPEPVLEYKSPYGEGTVENNTFQKISEWDTSDLNNIIAGKDKVYSGTTDRNVAREVVRQRALITRSGGPSYAIVPITNTLVTSTNPEIIRQARLGSSIGWHPGWVPVELRVASARDFGGTTSYKEVFSGNVYHEGITYFDEMPGVKQYVGPTGHYVIQKGDNVYLFAFNGNLLRAIPNVVTIEAFRDEANEAIHEDLLKSPSFYQYVAGDGSVTTVWSFSKEFDKIRDEWLGTLSTLVQKIAPQAQLRLAEAGLTWDPDKIEMFSGTQFGKTVMVALSPNFETDTLFHELWHFLERHGFFTDEQMAIVESEMPRLKKLMVDRYGEHKAFDDPAEVRAYAAGMYIDGLFSQDKNTHQYGKAAGVFNWLYQLIKGLKDKLLSRGVTSADDVFYMVYSGKVGKQQSGRISPYPGWLNYQEGASSEANFIKALLGEKRNIDALADTIVKERNGLPKMVFHYSESNPAFIETEGFRTIHPTSDFGYHFGSSVAANTIWKNRIKATPKGFIIPAYLNIKKALRIPDSMVWTPHQVMKDIIYNDQVEIVGENKVESIESYRKGLNDEVVTRWQKRYRDNPSKAGEEFKTYLKNRFGVDGIIYNNDVEGGGDSYMVFDNSQIYPIFESGSLEDIVNKIYTPDKARPALSILSLGRRAFTSDPNRYSPPRNLTDLSKFTGVTMSPRTVAALHPKFAPVWRMNNDKKHERDRIMQQYAGRIADMMTKEKEKTINRVMAAAEVARMHSLRLTPGPDGTITVANDLIEDQPEVPQGEVLRLDKHETDLYLNYQATMNNLLRELRAAQLESIDEYRQLPGLNYDGTTAEFMTWTKDIANDVLQKAATGSMSEDEAASQLELIGGLYNLWVHYDMLLQQDYVPFSREGDNAVVAKDEKGRITYFKTFEGKYRDVKPKIDALKKELADKHPEWAITDKIINQDDLKRIYANADIVSSMDALSGMLSTTSAETYDKLRDEFYRLLKEKRGPKFALEAKRVPGYSRDWRRSLGEYFAASANYISNARFDHRLDQAVADIANIPELKDLHRYALDEVNYNRSSQEELMFFRNLGFFWHLGANVSSAVLQLISLWQIMAPRMMAFANPGKVAFEVNKAAAQAITMIRFPLKQAVSGTGEQSIYESILKSKLPADEKAMLRYAFEHGYLRPALTGEQMGLDTTPRVSWMPHNRLKAFQKMVRATSFIFNQFETTARLASMLSAYRIAKSKEAIAKADKTLSQDGLWMFDKSRNLINFNGDFNSDAFKLANHVTEDAFGVFGKGNRPRYMRAFKGLPLALLQFQQYPQFIIELFGKVLLNQGPIGRMTFINMSLATILWAGAFGLPGADDLRGVIEYVHKKVTGKDLDLENEFRMMAYEYAGGNGASSADAISRGLISSKWITGLDISSRVSYGNVPAADIIGKLVGGGEASDAMGVSATYTVELAKRLSESYKQGKLSFSDPESLFFAVGDVAPTAVRNLVKAWEWNTRGVTSAKGNVLVTPEELTWGDVAAKAMGFTSKKIADARKEQYSLNRLQAAAADASSMYRERLIREMTDMVRARRDGDSQAYRAARIRIRDLMDEIVEFNRGQEPANRVNIDRKALRREVAFNLNPSLRIAKMRKLARLKAREIQRTYNTE